MGRSLRPLAVVALTLVVIGASNATNSSGASSDTGFLQRFAPRSATIWWAIVASNLHAKTWVVRTTDSGRHWRAVTPPVKLVSSSAFLGTRTAWIETGSLHAGAPGAPRTEPVYRTLDGGHTWQRLGRVATECQLDFVDRRHGWCIDIGAATGSATVHLYHTNDGGAAWRLISRTGLYDHGSTPGALPYGCDKTIAFTSPRIGWAAATCNGGESLLYTSRDGGARWHQLAPVPLPKRLRLGGGTEMSVPAVHGSRLTISLDVGPVAAGYGRTVIATSTNRGRGWHSRLAPGNPGDGGVDLVNTHHFVLSNGNTLLTTNDTGRHWHALQATKKLLNRAKTSLTPEFLSPKLGFAIPTLRSGPMWWTDNGGTTWKRLEIKAGPFTLR